MIFNNENKKSKTLDAAKAQPLSEILKKDISDRLKIVNKLLKDGNLDEAKVELDAVRAMDPKNGYIHALEERREELLKEKDNPQSVGKQETGSDSSLSDEMKNKIETEYLKKFAEEIQKFEERLEAEYNDRITEEMNKGEQRIVEMLKEERERNNAEKAALIANFEWEKDKLLKEMKKETRKAFYTELKKADDSYREELTNEIKKAEEKIRAEMNALYKETIVELKEAVVDEKSQPSELDRKALIEETRKQIEDELRIRFMEELARGRSQLLDMDRKSIVEEAKKQIEDEFQKRFMEELAKERSTVALIKEKLEEEEKRRLQLSVEEKPETELERIEKEIDAQRSELERLSEERYRRAIQDTRVALNKKLSKVRKNDPKNQSEIEERLAEIQKELVSDFRVKSEEQLTRERELLEKLREKEFGDIRNGVNWKDRSRKQK